MTNTIKFKKLREDAVIPTKGTPDSSGFDLTILGEGKVFDDVILYSTGISVEPPVGYYFDTVPRSSISKTGYTMANSIGIIDSDYRGELFVPLRKTNKAAKDILADGPVRIAQLILRKRHDFPVEVVTELSDTARGDGGFGSTDKPITTLPLVSRQNSYSYDIVSEWSKTGLITKDIKIDPYTFATMFENTKNYHVINHLIDQQDVFKLSYPIIYRIFKNNKLIQATSRPEFSFEGQENNPKQKVITHVFKTKAPFYIKTDEKAFEKVVEELTKEINDIGECVMYLPLIAHSSMFDEPYQTIKFTARFWKPTNEQ